MRAVLLGAISIGLAVSSTISFAGDEEAKALLEQAKLSFNSRAEAGSYSYATAVELLDKAEAEAEDPELLYEILILASRVHYWQGGDARSRTDREKIPVYELGMAKAKAAKELIDDYAEGYYFFAINLGKWALAKNPLVVLNRKPELIRNAEGARERITREGELGESIDGYGPDRLLGRMYSVLPWAAGGRRDKALRYLENAHANAPRQALNVVYYAETLSKGDGAEKKKAKELLDAMLAQEPGQFNADRLAETIEEFEEARALRRTLE